MNKAIILQNGQQHIRYFEAPCLLSELLTDFSVAHPCGGKGTCRKCRVEAVGDLSEPTAAESAVLGSNVRLCCQTLALGDVTITLSDTKTWNKSSASNHLAAVHPLGKKFGFVVDLGTTTVSAALYDQTTAKPCAQTVFPNPQSAFGADVLSRLHAAMHGKASLLSQSVQNALHAACSALLQNTGLSSADVDAAVLTGNTAMLYLLFEQDPACISVSPFRCETRFGDFYDADFLPLCAGTKVFVPHCISAFLGADILTASLASHVWDEGVHLLADLGTNGEILLQKDGDVLGCSCAAGPAFEGAGLECGMPAVDGAIESVKLFGGKLLPKIHGNANAMGICGSGLIDLIACLRKMHILTPDGLLTCGDRYIIEGTDVYLTQADIRAFQLSKSAIRTGMDLLLREAGVQKPDCVEIAGTFGTHLSLPSAKAVGLLGNFPQNAVSAIGNAASTGAAMLLLDNRLIRDCAEKSTKIRSVQLTEHREFNALLLQNLML